MPKDAPSAYLVEIEPHGLPETGTLSARARETAGETRFLRSVYVPEDDRWFLLYEGSSVADVAAAVERADLEVVSVAVAREIPGERSR